ncbi:MAG: hypothetical protein IPJ65_42675 [Archangiaceae bacterium]|nr:hypothetical protein [Archangiaceae bacterium]
MIFPLPDERERYIEHGTGLGYRHGQRRNPRHAVRNLRVARRRQPLVSA